MRRFMLVAAIGCLAAVASFSPAGPNATSAPTLADPSLPPPPASGSQFAVVVLPDPQAYTQSYDIVKGGEKWGGKGYQYKERLDQQVRWIVENRARYNVRFAVSVGDSVQHFGFDPARAKNPGSYDAKCRGEWINARRAYDIFHAGADPAAAVVVPYAVACGNHDYHRGDRSTLDTPEYVQYFGPGHWRDAGGAVRAPSAAWYLADDKDWPYVVGGRTVATGVGRNSLQSFTADGRRFLHLTLGCAATDQALAWAREQLDKHPGKPTIVTTHAFLDGGGKWLPAARMGRTVRSGPNPNNSAQGIWDKLIKGRDQIFMVLCGHTYSQAHSVATNSAGHEVHILESCYHLNYGGGRILLSQKPPGGWAYKGQTDDLDRNGSGWLRVLLFDPDEGTVSVFTYSPVLDLWAPDREPEQHSGPDGQNGVWRNRTFPVGDNVVERFRLDLRARFGHAPAPAGSPSPAEGTGAP